MVAFQYLPSVDVHVNKAAKLDPSSKVYEVIRRLLFIPLLNGSVSLSPMASVGSDGFHKSDLQ